MCDRLTETQRDAVCVETDRLRHDDIQGNSCSNSVATSVVIAADGDSHQFRSADTGSDEIATILSLPEKPHLLLPEQVNKIEQKKRQGKSRFRYVCYRQDDIIS